MVISFPGFSFLPPISQTWGWDTIAGNLATWRDIDKNNHTKSLLSLAIGPGQGKAHQDRKFLDSNYSIPAKHHRKTGTSLALYQQRLSGEVKHPSLQGCNKVPQTPSGMVSQPSRTLELSFPLVRNEDQSHSVSGSCVGRCHPHPHPAATRRLHLRCQQRLSGDPGILFPPSNNKVALLPPSKWCHGKPAKTGLKTIQYHIALIQKCPGFNCFKITYHTRTKKISN